MVAIAGAGVRRKKVLVEGIGAPKCGAKTLASLFLTAPELWAHPAPALLDLENQFFYRRFLALFTKFARFFPPQ
jgi:hypothetical protein